MKHKTIRASRKDDDFEVRSLITRTIKDQVADWIQKGRIHSTCEVGSGQCYDFAEELAQKLKHISSISIRETEEWWSDVFIADVGLLRKAGEPLPQNRSDNEIATIVGGATHAWISWQGLHFDATAPDGCEHFLEMPFFAEQLR